jgi:hypothetical protein
MNRIPTVIIFSDSNHSPCSAWRSHGPFLELSRLGHINLMVGTWDDSWTTLRLADIAFFQRPMSKNCELQIFTAKDLGLKAWIDLDDSNILSPSHEVYNIWCEEYDELSFKKIMMLADVVTVTNKPLQDYYLAYNNNVKIIPNAINDYWLNINKFSNKKIVTIRGGGHHLNDVWEYRKEIIEVMNNHKDWELHVLGGEIKFLSDKISNYKFIGDFDIHRYFGYLMRFAPGIIILPLSDNDLNRCKSNIGWQESTLCGGTALTPHWWKLNDYSLTYKDNKSFANNFERLITDEGLRKELWTKSVQKVKKDYLLSNVNKKRIEIIKNLMK